jgi:hypothetical protein
MEETGGYLGFSRNRFEGLIGTNGANVGRANAAWRKAEPTVAASELSSSSLRLGHVAGRPPVTANNGTGKPRNISRAESTTSRQGAGPVPFLDTGVLMALSPARPSKVTTMQRKFE